MKTDRYGREIVRRRCLRCGWKGWARPRKRKCYQSRFGKGSYACWGDLAPIIRQTKVSEQEAAMMPTMTGKRPQDLAQKKLDYARKMVTAKTKQMRRLATSLRLWESRATYYARRASMTDWEIATEKQKREADTIRRQDAKTKRAVAVGEL